MAFSTDDFSKVWASTSPLTPYEFSDSNYQQGWNFIGSTPPARQMWDYLQKQNDEKAQWLYNAHNDILEMLKSLIPTGVVQAFAGSTTPQGWLLCDGSAVSRTDYADLYAVIGDTYGAGDGSTTFNLPNLVDKFIQGNATSGTEKTAGLPNITGSSLMRAWNIDNGGLVTNTVGAFTIATTTTKAGGVQAYSNLNGNTFGFDASKSSAIYGNSTTVQPPAVTMRYIIKY